MTPFKGPKPHIIRCFWKHRGKRKHSQVRHAIQENNLRKPGLCTCQNTLKPPLPGLDNRNPLMTKILRFFLTFTLFNKQRCFPFLLGLKAGEFIMFASTQPSRVKEQLKRDEHKNSFYMHVVTYLRKL